MLIARAWCRAIVSVIGPVPDTAGRPGIASGVRMPRPCGGSGETLGGPATGERDAWPSLM